eukprot:g1979.t1
MIEQLVRSNSSDITVNYCCSAGRSAPTSTQSLESEIGSENENENKPTGKVKRVFVTGILTPFSSLTPGLWSFKFAAEGNADESGEDDEVDEEDVEEDEEDEEEDDEEDDEDDEEDDRRMVW